MVERASPFTVDAADSARDVTVRAVPRGALWQVAAWPETCAAVEADLAKTCGCTAPGPGRAVVTRDGGLLIRIEPLKWWITGPDGMDCPLMPDPDNGVWLDMGHDQAGIEIAGPQAVEVLKRMVSIDLRDGAFPDLSFATTHMHHMITRVLRKDGDGRQCYQVMVMRSYADDLREIVEHHLHSLPG